MYGTGIAIGTCLAGAALAMAGDTGTDGHWGYTGQNAWTESNWLGDVRPDGGGNAIFGTRSGGTQSVIWANDNEGLWMPDLGHLVFQDGADPNFGAQGLVGTTPTITTSLMTCTGAPEVSLSSNVWLHCDHSLTGWSGELTLNSASRLSIGNGGILMDADLTVAGSSVFEQTDPGGTLSIGWLVGDTVDFPSFAVHTGATATIAGAVRVEGDTNDAASLIVWGGDVDVAGNIGLTAQGGSATVYVSNNGQCTAGSMKVDGLESRGDYGNARISVEDGGHLQVTGDVHLAWEQDSYGDLDVGTPSPIGDPPQAVIDGTLTIGWLGTGGARVYDEASLTVSQLGGGNIAGSDGWLSVHDTGQVTVTGDLTLGTLTPMTVHLDGGNLTVAGTSMIGMAAEFVIASDAVFETGGLTLLDGADFTLEEGECIVNGGLSTDLPMLHIQEGARLTLRGTSTVAAALDIGATSPRNGVEFARVAVDGADVTLSSAPMIGGHGPGELLLSSGAVVDVSSADPILLGDDGDIFMSSSQLTCNGIDATGADAFPSILQFNSSMLESNGSVLMPLGFIYTNGGSIDIDGDLTLGYLTTIASEMSIAGTCTLGIPSVAALGMTIHQPQAGELHQPTILAAGISVLSDVQISLTMPDPASALGQRWAVFAAPGGSITIDPQASFSLPDLGGFGLSVSAELLGSAVYLDFKSLIDGDCDLDLDVDHDDLLTVLEGFVSCDLSDPNQAFCIPDIDRDGGVGVGDLLLLLENWAP